MARRSASSGNSRPQPEAMPRPPATSVVETDAQGGTSHPVTVIPPQLSYRQIQVSESIEAHFSTVPMPAPDSLAKLQALYPNAPAVIFNQMQAQAKHRIAMETSNLATKAKLALRGQIFAFALGGTGLFGSFIVIGLGHDVAGATMGGITLVSLVGLFLNGQTNQRKGLAAREVIRSKIAGRQPVEDVESPSPDAITPTTNTLPDGPATPR